MIFSVEKTLKENGDKLSEEDKANLEQAIAHAKEELASDDNDRIKAATEKLSNDAQAAFAKVYQQAQQAQGAQGAEDDSTEFHQGPEN